MNMLFLVCIFFLSVYYVRLLTMREKPSPSTPCL